MSYFQLIEGAVIGLYVLSSLFSFFLSSRNVEKQVNRIYSVFALLMACEVFFQYINYYEVSAEKFVFYNKVINSCIILASFCFILFISKVTGYKSRKFLIGLMFTAGFVFSLNFFLPCGIVYRYVLPGPDKTILWGEIINTKTYETSNWLFTAMIYTILVFVFVVKALLFQKKRGDSQNFKLIIVASSIGIGGIFVENIMLQLKIADLLILDDFCFLAFVLIISHRNFTNVFEASKIKSSFVESQQLYKTLMNNMNDAIVLLDKNRVVQFVNNKFCELMEYEYKDVIEKPAEEFLIGKDGNTVAEVIGRVEKSHQIEVTLKNKSGHLKDFLAGISPRFDGNGDITGSLSVMTDVSEKNMTEKSLRKSLMNFQSVFEYSPFPISINITKNGVMVEVNPSFLKFFNIDKEHVINHTIQSFAGENKEEAIDIFFKKGKLENFITTFEIGSIKKTMLLNSNKIDFNDETCTLTVFQDITELEETKKKIEDANLYMQYLIDSISAVIISVDFNLQVKYFNNASLQYRNPDEISSNYFFDKFSKLKFIQEDMAVVISKNEVYKQTKMVVGSDGLVDFYEISIYPLSDLESKGYVIMLENITEKKKMEEMMIQTEKMMSLSGLAAGMAHEINNPLGTIVQGCHNIVRRTSKDLSKNLVLADELGINFDVLNSYFEKRQIYEIISSMKNAAIRASEIIQNMLQFSRKSESKKQEYSISKLIDEVLELANSEYDLKKKYDFKSITVVKEIAEDLPEIRITVTEIQQVLYNIIRNAAQAIKQENSIEKKPTLILRAFKEGDYLVIEIEDNGPGIPDKIKNKIFEPFFTTKEVGEGTGLGLSVSFMIIKNNHNGILNVDSAKNCGTVFQIKLPVER
jgi:PAS domain S-box-containing protein